jgi:hypothetical protein
MNRLRPQPTYSPSIVQQPFIRTVGMSSRATSISFKQPRTRNFWASKLDHGDNFQWACFLCLFSVETLTANLFYDFDAFRCWHVASLEPHKYPVQVVAASRPITMTLVTVQVTSDKYVIDELWNFTFCFFEKYRHSGRIEKKYVENIDDVEGLHGLLCGSLSLLNQTTYLC